MTMGAVRIGAEAGRAAENPRRCFCDRELAPKVRGHLGDGSLSCGTGPWLTREYQGDHRRQSLTSTSISAALDISSHIKHREVPGGGLSRGESRGSGQWPSNKPDVRSNPGHLFQFEPADSVDRWRAWSSER
jgi:hypothetical protein